jgi:outer membrane protein OmpA-like peptidoglycan-associated protein/tetratricopeptide (TPR) repeat protein
MKRYLPILLLLCFGSAVGQPVLKRADRLYDAMAYTEAAAEYEKYLSGKENPDTNVLLRAAEAHYHIGNTAKALSYFDKAFSRQAVVFKPEMFLHYIDVLRVQGNYTKADQLLWKEYTDNNRADVLQKLISQKVYLDSLNKTEPKFKVTNLDSNTAVADFGTVFYKDKVVYASAKDSLRDGAKTYAWNEQPYLELYVASRNADGSFKDEKKFLKNAQTGYHNAAVAFSPINKIMFVSVNNVGKKDKLKNSKDGSNTIQLVYGKVEGETLINKKPAPFNSPDYNVGQPAVSTDGNWLLFVSDMPGGYGGTDIYRAPIFNDGRIGKPINMGETINTKGDEMFPFATADALYFSSNGHYGLGGLDVFVSRMEADWFTHPENTTGETFTMPKNLGMPINSNRDDFGYILSDDGKYGYLSSNRAGGKGDDDIYYFEKDDKCGRVIAGTVTNPKSGQPVEGVEIKAQADGITYQDISKADGSYSITIPCNAEVTVLEATKPGYVTGKMPLDSKSRADLDLIAYKDLVKQRGDIELIDINPIYFDFDQYYITPQAAAELDKVVFVMESFPEVIIKIESHTDSRGKDDYNLRLSDDRAKSTYSYIVSKGIDLKRIESVHGYGETRLLNKCSNGVECTEEEHQLNRRSDFIIVKK